MQKDTSITVNSLVDDLEILIAEIESNPHLSSWVVRMALKCIKEKAEKMTGETAPQQVYLGLSRLRSGNNSLSGHGAWGMGHEKYS